MPVIPAASRSLQRALAAVAASVAVLAAVSPSAALAGPVDAPVIEQPVDDAPGETAAPSETPAPTDLATPSPSATSTPMPTAPASPGSTVPATPGQAPTTLPPLPTDPAAPVDPVLLPVVTGAPSWADIASAAGNPTASAPLVSSLNAQLAALDAQIADAERAASDAGTAYQQAQSAADLRRYELDQLDEQAADAQARAEDSSAAIGGMAAHLRSHTGGVSPQVIAFFDASPRDDYLSQATTLNRFADNADDLYNTAVADQAELERLQAEAQTALADAEALAADAALKRDAAAAAQTSLLAQRESAAQASGQLDVMLDVLAEGRTPTRADYDALLAAQQSAYDAGVAALAALGASPLGALGAAAPMGGQLKLTDGYGGRIAPTSGASSFHEGLDIVQANGATLGAVLYAVLPGTITYAGPMGSYGNMVEIDLGNGTRLRYAHIADGGIGVKVGDTVTAGQPIALAGSTGVSTGAHLHFEVRVAGVAVDPAPWLRGLKIIA